MSSIGPQVSVEKCELWSPNPELDTSLLPPEITVQKLGLKNLGAPVSGNHDFVQRMFSRRVEMGKELMESNRLLEDPQLELQLLRSCAALPKIIFSLRTCEPSSVYSPLSDFDSVVHSAFEAKTGSVVFESTFAVFTASFEGRHWAAHRLQALPCRVSRQLCRHQDPR